MRTILVLFLTLFIINASNSQSEVSVNDVRNIFDEKGDYYFDRKDFKKAIVYYNMAFDLDGNNYYSVLRKAQAYEALGLYDQAAESFRILFGTKLYIPNEHRLEAALLLLKNKDVKGFEKRMEEYNEIVSSEIHGYLSDQNVRAKMYKDSTLLIVENESVLNTPEAEICPTALWNLVIFASTRKNLAAYGSNPFLNLYTASYVEGGQLGRLNKYNNSLTTAQSESWLTSSKKTNRIYFTRANPDGSGMKSYSAVLPTGADVDLKPEELRLEGFPNIGHISFNKEGNLMYFVSDAPGGSGGLDIYVSQLENGSWGKPKNLGSTINSNEDEMYPYVLNDTVLYFSSTGHDGLGGLDLYAVNLNEKRSTPKNLGSKVNTKYDDYALSFTPKGLTGYFCSNRPGGFGKEDIYRLHMLDIKVKLAAYKFKRKTTMEEDKINLYLNSGSEYNIAEEGNTGFNFGFRPEEPYKMIIRHENTLVTDVMYNPDLLPEQRARLFLRPKAVEETMIRLDPGMKYEFTAGMKPIGEDYKAALNEMKQEYSGGSGTIDLTALAKELLLREGEVYTIRFVPDDDRFAEGKSKEITTLFVNGQEVPVTGNSFFIVLPLDVEANFNIKTDIAHLKDNFSPKKVGGVKVDEAAVLKEQPVKESEGFPILVNTESFSEVIKGKEIRATELSIIPGSMYILAFKRTDAPDDDQGVVIPLTKGVKYDLGTDNESQEAYMKSLSQIKAASDNTSGELIDIGVLSKELDIAAEKEIVFSLTPAKEFGQQEAARNVLTTLAVDGRKYYITKMQRLQVNLKLPQNERVNIQTDLTYVKDNFDASTIALKVDTTSLSKDIEKKNEITDPVFDVITINFNLNDYAIQQEAKITLADEVIKVLLGDNRLYVTIKGYTDPLGDAAYNEKLSRNRAQAVKDFLSNNGIGESRIRTFSFGETGSLKAGEKWEDMSEEELQKHRKVEIVMYLPK
ncbi:MAG: OmpA family protein [Bacteroidales bacterium]|nr:OmpA family protein [Bacteroidales bacterium]